MEAAAAATVAEKDKQQRYPPAGGRVVRTFAMEMWGRLGNEAEEALTTLAAEATHHARRHGHVVTAGSFLRRWRASLDASLQRGVAAAWATKWLPGLLATVWPESQTLAFKTWKELSCQL